MCWYCAGFPKEVIPWSCLHPSHKLNNTRARSYVCNTHLATCRHNQSMLYVHTYICVYTHVPTNADCRHTLCPVSTVTSTPTRNKRGTKLLPRRWRPQYALGCAVLNTANGGIQETFDVTHADGMRVVASVEGKLHWARFVHQCLNITKLLLRGKESAKVVSS